MNRRGYLWTIAYIMVVGMHPVWNCGIVYGFMFCAETVLKMITALSIWMLRGVVIVVMLAMAYYGTKSVINQLVEGRMDE